MYARGGLFRHAAHFGSHSLPVTFALGEHPAQEGEQLDLVLGVHVGIEHRRILLRLHTLVDEQGGVAAVVDNHVRTLAAGEVHRLERTPPVVGERLAFPCKHGHAHLGDGSRGVVLCGVDVAGRPAYLGTQGDERLDEHGGLDGHVQRAHHAGTFERLRLAVFFAQCHQSGHFFLSHIDFLTSEFRQ